MVFNMDHNLEDSLNLDSSIGIDFEHDGDVVVSQADMGLDTASHDGGMHMEFEHIEEQPILMDTGNEEIIDFMGDQFALQEYSIQDDQTTSATTTEESNQQNILSSQSDPMLDMQFSTQTVLPAKKEVQVQPKYISLKAAPAVTKAPRAVAIAPKPAPRAVPIAPRPVALVSSKSLVKKVPLSSVINAGGKGNTVLAQIGKQLVMMPHNTPKIKLVTSGSSGVGNFQYIKANTSQAQLISTKNVTGIQGGKPIMAKVIVQGQSNLDQSSQQTIITKILPANTASAPQARYVMQQKTVPISLGNKVLLASPTKQGMKFTKKQQVISIKSPTPKLMPAPPSGASKKVVISAAPQQNVMLKTAPPKTAQVTKEGKVVVQGQRSQIHQINVPGKGVQYIRLITNPPSSTKTASRASVQSLPGQPKSFVLTDSKGNLIQVSSENSISGHQTQVYTGNSGNAAPKWQQKLVRIASAPAVPKTTTVTTSSMRSSQSLLAPLSPLGHSIKLENTRDYSPSADERGAEVGDELESEHSVADSKTALQALIADAVENDLAMQEVEVEFENSQQSPVESENEDSMDPLETGEGQDQHPLIVIPSNYIKTDAVVEDEYSRQQDDSSMMNLEGEMLNTYVESPSSPQLTSEGEVVIKSDFGLRPRRACNCTKSQCLKLYCDCFANGEFCNRCNCNNCYNNLNYEELRQKAIRACLERNPNAFRPKIGKTKAGGPEIIRRHNKGCNCKRSGCLKNYCECYEAKIACTAMCKCFGCRNVEETLHRRRRELPHPLYRPPPLADLKQPCSFVTTEVIEAVCQCLLAASVESGDEAAAAAGATAAAAAAAAGGDPVRLVLDEFARCLQDIITASRHAAPHEGNT